jgi:hypothetical protein
LKFAIHIDDMTASELAAVTAFITSIGASPVARTVTELAAATTQQPSPPPPPAPNMPAPPALGAPLAPVGGIPQYDSRGLPHNPAFYADSKRQNADGSWAKRKGVDKAACDAWEASVPRGTPATPQQPPAPPVGNVPLPAASVSPANAPSSVSPTAAEINAKFAPGLPPQGANGDPFAAPAQPAAPPAPPAPPVEVTYAAWHQMYMNLMTAGKITPEKYAEIAGRYNAVEDPMTFMNNAASRAACYREFEALAAA